MKITITLLLAVLLSGPASAALISQTENLTLVSGGVGGLGAGGAGTVTYTIDDSFLTGGVGTLSVGSGITAFNVNFASFNLTFSNGNTITETFDGGLFPASIAYVGEGTTDNFNLTDGDTARTFSMVAKIGSGVVVAAGTASAVPEPMSFSLIGVALCGLGLMRRFGSLAYRRSHHFKSLSSQFPQQLTPHPAIIPSLPKLRLNRKGPHTHVSTHNRRRPRTEEGCSTSGRQRSSLNSVRHGSCE